MLRPHRAGRAFGDGGDDLEALKALLPCYRSQVRCIFIDPPHNRQEGVRELMQQHGRLPPTFKSQTPQPKPQTPQPEPVPEALARRLPAAGTRPRRELLQALIVDLCAWKPHSARELAVLLGRRDHKHLVQEVLSPLVAQGLLAFTIPTMEKHPEQRYIAGSPTSPPA